MLIFSRRFNVTMFAHIMIIIGQSENQSGFY